MDFGVGGGGGDIAMERSVVSFLSTLIIIVVSLCYRYRALISNIISLYSKLFLNSFMQIVKRERVRNKREVLGASIFTYTIPRPPNSSLLLLQTHK